MPKEIEDLKQAVSDGIKDEKELTVLIDATLKPMEKTEADKQESKTKILAYIKSISTVEQLNNLEQFILELTKEAIVTPEVIPQTLIKSEEVVINPAVTTQETNSIVVEQPGIVPEEKVTEEAKKIQEVLVVDNSAAFADLAVKTAFRQENTKIRQKIEMKFLEELQSLKKQNLSNDWLEKVIFNCLLKKNGSIDNELVTSSIEKLKQNQSQETITTIDKLVAEVMKLIA